MSKKYLSADNNSPSIPIFQMLWTATAFKVFDAPEWLWGVAGVFYFTLTVYALIKIFTYEKVEL